MMGNVCVCTCTQILRPNAFAGSHAALSLWLLVVRYDRDHKRSCYCETTFPSQGMNGLVAEPLSHYCSCFTRP